MTSLIETLTAELQLWLGETAKITPRDVAQMLSKAQDNALQLKRPVALRIEGEPEDVAQIVQTCKATLDLTEQKVSTAILDDGRIRRELIIAGQAEDPEEMSEARPGNLNPEAITPALPKPAPVERSASEKLLYEALQTIARGLLEFPKDDTDRRQFGSAYPPLFKDGIGKLSAFFLAKGTVLNDSLEYWRLLSKPLKEWPHMPPHLQSPDPLIDTNGRTTVLTEFLAQRR
jgi:hypothetical protein